MPTLFMKWLFFASACPASAAKVGRTFNDVPYVYLSELDGAARWTSNTEQGDRNSAISSSHRKYPTSRDTYQRHNFPHHPVFPQHIPAAVVGSNCQEATITDIHNQQGPEKNTQGWFYSHLLNWGWVTRTNEDKRKTKTKQPKMRLVPMSQWNTAFPWFRSYFVPLHLVPLFCSYSWENMQLN